MAIAITKTVANVISRAGGVFVSEDDGTTYFDVGRVKSTKMEFSEVNTEADVAGREVQLAVDITLTTVLQQTSDTEIQEVDDMVAVATNGVWVKFTDEFSNAAGAGAASGYTFKNAFPTFSGEIMFDNTESTITMTIKGRVNVTDFAALGSSGEIVFDG